MAEGWILAYGPTTDREPQTLTVGPTEILECFSRAYLVLQLIGLFSGSPVPLQPVLGLFPILGAVCKTKKDESRSATLHIRYVVWLHRPNP